MWLDTSKITEYAAKLKDCLTGRQRIAINTAVGKRVGAAAVRYAADYPEPSGKPLPKIYQRQGKHGTFLSKFKSQAMQGKVMAMAAEGKFPYRRTGKLGQSMTFALQEVTEHGVTVEVGTNDPKAPFVLDEERQAAYHKGTWMTLPETMNQNAAKLSDVAANTFIVEMDKRLA